MWSMGVPGLLRDSSRLLRGIGLFLVGAGLPGHEAVHCSGAGLLSLALSAERGVGVGLVLELVV